MPEMRKKKEGTEKRRGRERRAEKALAGGYLSGGLCGGKKRKEEKERKITFLMANASYQSLVNGTGASPLKE